MVYRDRAVEAVRAAELKLRADLRPIILEAIEADAYGDVAAIARIAAALSKLLIQVATDSYDSEPDAPSLEEVFATDPPVSQEPVSASKADSEGQRALIRAPFRPAPPRPRKASGEYPRFLRDGDRLVKLAWSKKKRRPYEHRAPKAIVEELLAAIRKRKGEGKLFEAAAVLPLTNGNGEEYPSYQPYLALTWLRQVGVIAKRGRSGYVLKAGAATPENIERFWTSLAAAE